MEKREEQKQPLPNPRIHRGLQLALKTSLALSSAWIAKDKAIAPIFNLPQEIINNPETLEKTGQIIEYIGRGDFYLGLTCAALSASLFYDIYKNH